MWAHSGLFAPKSFSQSPPWGGCVCVRTNCGGDAAITQIAVQSGTKVSIWEPGISSRSATCEPVSVTLTSSSTSGSWVPHCRWEGWRPSFRHPLNNCFLSTYCAPGTSMIQRRTKYSFCSHGACVEAEADENQTKQQARR